MLWKTVYRNIVHTSAVHVFLPLIQYVHHYTVTLKMNQNSQARGHIRHPILNIINLLCHVASFPGSCSLSVRGKEPGYMAKFHVQLITCR